MRDPCGTQYESRLPRNLARGRRRAPAGSVRSRDPRPGRSVERSCMPFSRIFHDCRDSDLTARSYSCPGLQTSGGFMLTDARGSPTSTSSSASLQQYERALDLCASYELDPLAIIQKALDADPTFALGHCLRAGLAVMATDRAAVPM